MFLLARGQYAYIGYAWQGCQCLATDSYDASTCIGSQNLTYELPELLERDYGEPVGVGGQHGHSRCAETSAGSGVFRREWTKAAVQMDCNTWTATIEMT
jgi:hypothetical protein